MANERVRTLWSDLNGLTHGRYVPSRKIDRDYAHTHHAVTTLAMGIDGEILPIKGYAADVGYPDLTATPVVSSAGPAGSPTPTS